MTVIFSYKLRNVTYKTNAYCSQRSGIGPLGLLLNIFLSHLFFFIFPLFKTFCYNKIRTFFLQIIGLVDFIEQNENDANACIDIASALIRIFWPLVCFSDWFHKYDSHTIWESKKSNL